MIFGVLRDMGDSFRKGKTILAIHGLKKGSADVISHVFDYFTGRSYISPLTPGYFKKR